MPHRRHRRPGLARRRLVCGAAGHGADRRQGDFYRGWAHVWAQQVTDDGRSAAACRTCARPVAGAPMGRSCRQPAFGATAARFTPMQPKPAAGRHLPLTRIQVVVSAGAEFAPRCRTFSASRTTRIRGPGRAERRLPAPVADQQPAEQHPARCAKWATPGCRPVNPSISSNRPYRDHQRAALSSGSAGSAASPAGSGNSIP